MMELCEIKNQCLRIILERDSIGHDDRQRIRDHKELKCFRRESNYLGLLAPSDVIYCTGLCFTMWEYP